MSIEILPRSDESLFSERPAVLSIKSLELLYAAEDFIEDKFGGSESADNNLDAAESTASTTEISVADHSKPTDDKADVKIAGISESDQKLLEAEHLRMMEDRARAEAELARFDEKPRKTNA